MGGVEERVLVVGAGPVGLVAASALAEAGIPVTVLEASTELPKDLRASTFHPPTLDMLDRFGVTDRLIERGLICPHWQFRDRTEGVIATFDLGILAGETSHPYRLQCEQWKLTEMLRDRMEEKGLLEIVYNASAEGVTQDENGVEVTFSRPDGASETIRGRFLIAADGAHSAIRRSLDIEFEGLTIPEIFLSMSTTFDFDAAIPDLSPIAYLTDPDEWAVLLRTPSLWRVLLPTDPELTEDEIKAPETMERRLQKLCPKDGAYDVVHATAYRVHQRVAKSYVAGRVFLAGDSAHLNNPLGGMGMNGGVHDAINLTDKLVDVWNGKAPLESMARYERQRRKACIDTVQAQTIRNRQIMAENDPEARKAYHDELRRTVADPEAHKTYLMRSSMIQSLRDLEAVA
ncbi:FAD-dependent oxidoreductase [Amorphus orientalis]|uniref:3-(3-hydroxy-phenyl)propionate hydroxylase n=1 Tax=Amorphus orientalis TaxID=649198 RepID=A0AAE3VR98_9HYPH|nr:NAD(P)/FAD-dependent oxidoreductase [Amorphus orientalis]MDQ0316877.1 3-(3-hydroxy-phenyl)propionate hydroxylase [Amorphus orientalis]